MTVLGGVGKGKSGSGGWEWQTHLAKNDFSSIHVLYRQSSGSPGVLLPLLFTGLVSVCDVQSSRSSWCRMRPVPISMPTAADHVLTSGQRGSLHPSTRRPLSSLENPKSHC